MGESHDQPVDKKENLTAGWGGVTEDEEEPLWKIYHEYFWGFIRWFNILIVNSIQFKKNLKKKKKKENCFLFKNCSLKFEIFFSKSERNPYCKLSNNMQF